jgi:hypothetical protein
MLLGKSEFNHLTNILALHSLGVGWIFFFFFPTGEVQYIKYLIEIKNKLRSQVLNSGF